MRIRASTFLDNPITDGEASTQFPDTSELLDRNETRRLPPIVKAALYNALKCLQLAGSPAIEGIITGTGKGAVNSIEKFQTDIIEYNETALNPAVFIQSTHNTLGGLIAIRLDATVHNSTHVNLNQTVLNVLLESSSLLKAGKAPLLIGFFDEVTVFDKVIYDKCGWLNSTDMISSPVTWNQNSAFFLIDNDEIPGVYIRQLAFYALQEQDAFKRKISELSGNAGDIILYAGDNNDWEWQHEYLPLTGLLKPERTVHFKRAYGESPTATSTALALACSQLSADRPKALIVNKFFGLGLELIFLEYC